ncbi:MAG: hypothetical protein J3T61_07635 [Candidatus Brocadiales bacterium]|nr:hypothetical protein [Candidatus Bathyanammoxibius sp.]
MFYAFQNIVLGTWDFWCGLFGLLPYGDPYIASVVLFVLVAMAARMVAGGETA